MPGIIPMKLIRCGSSQTRIAQACDRCRSKKIRCDGVRPCCSQCSNVGFECKTSDKLSRRAFPRGYTESLEERVRSLEQEVRELKDLLDAKDEQLDMLSRIHSFSPYSPPASASSGGHKAHKTLERARSGSVDMAQAVDETFVVQEAKELVKDGAEAAVYMGASSGRTFVELLKKKMHESGRPTQHVKIDAETFFNTREIVNPAADQQQTPSIKAPPRLLSDHLLVSYFQEYHPLFPVLHRPTFLALYEKLVSGDGSAASSLPNHAIAQLFLVFAIALQQNEPQNSLDQQQFDYQWQRALDRIIMESNLDTLQCLVLAQLYCFSRGDYTRLLQYKSLAVGTALRLGLNQNQRKFSLGALSGEMRKRAFWCVYCLDNFSAAMLGLPKLFKEDSIEAEYPSDIDDEYVSEKGFLPTLPGDSTKISSALALFRSSRVLAKVLETVYPTSSSHELSYGKLKELVDELDSWKNGLAPHLRLEFVNGTPATNIVHSRSPLLVLSYHYIRVLIHRPVVDSSLTHNKVSASLFAIRESSKCIIQIIQLLTERKLGFSFCLNRVQLLLLSGFTILYSSLDGALVKDSQKLVSGVLEELERGSGTIAKEFRAIASLVVSCEMRSTAAAGQVLHEGVRSNSLSPLSDHHFVKKSPIRRRMSSISEKMNFRRDKNAVTTRRACSQDLTMDTGFHSNYGNRTRLTSASLTDLSPPPLRGRYASPVPLKVSRPSTSYESQNFDFLWHLDASNTITDTTRSAISTDEWERMLAVMDASHAVHIYGDGSNTLLPPAAAAAAAAAATSATRTPTTTTDPGTTSRQVDAHWSLGGTNQPSSSFHRTPPSVSTLSDEGFLSEDGRTADLPGGGGEFLESEGLGDFLVPMMAAGGTAGGSLMDNGGDWGL